MDDAARIARMKSEILADIEAGKVPADVRRFSELHDYVDANEYGGFTEHDPDTEGWDALTDQANRCQTQVDNWLILGRPDHDCWENAVPYVSDGPLGHGWECGICHNFLQAG